jgi:hypothetical protein
MLEAVDSFQDSCSGLLEFSFAGWICRLALRGGNEYPADMVSDRDKATIAAVARRYGVVTVWLFGSSADQRRRGRDLAAC